MLAVCADVPRRLEGLSSRTGGFSLCSYHALGNDPALAEGFAHVVALDPPLAVSSDEALRARLHRVAPGYTHLAWGDAELRFAEQMHELEYGLRPWLVALYRDLRERKRVAGEELEHLLRFGPHPPHHPRPARVAGRLIRVLAELELVSLDRDLPALSLAGAQATELERSPAYRVYQRRHEDGQRFLTRAQLRRRT